MSIQTSLCVALASACLTLFDSAYASPDIPHGLSPQEVTLRSLRVRTLSPDALPSLGYWPFTAGETPPGASLARVFIEVEVAACGDLGWSQHPVPGSAAAGPFCVGLIEVDGTGFLVVGQPGARAYIVVPSTTQKRTDGRVTTAHHQHPVTPTAPLVEAVRAWARAPDAHR